MSSSVPPPRERNGDSAGSWGAALNEAIDRYHDVLTTYVDKGGEDHLALAQRMVERGAVFAGRPICSFLRPQFRSARSTISSFVRSSTSGPR